MKFPHPIKILFWPLLWVVVFSSGLILTIPVIQAASYRVFNLKVNVEWQVEKSKIQPGGVPVFETIGSGIIESTLYFPPSGGEALKNSCLGKITEYKFNNDPTPVSFSGVGVKNETISFYKPVWDGKNTITLSGVEYTVLPINVTIHNPVKAVTIEDKSVWDRMLGVFTESSAPGKVNEFKLNTAPHATNYFPKVYFNQGWFYANLTFVVEDKGVFSP